MEAIKPCGPMRVILLLDLRDDLLDWRHLGTLRPLRRMCHPEDKLFTLAVTVSRFRAPPLLLFLEALEARCK